MGSTKKISIGDHSYSIASALVGGEGGSENANTWSYDRADVGGEGVQKSPKCDDVIYEWSLAVSFYPYKTFEIVGSGRDQKLVRFCRQICVKS